LLRRLFVLCVLLAVAGVVFLAWSGDTSFFRARNLKTLGASLEDAKTTAAVKAAVSLNRSLRPHGLAVSTERGVVTLRGRVPDDALRTVAERVAASVPDVRQVVNQIEVSPGAARALPADRTLGETVDDRSLEVQVRLALSLNRELRDADIRVEAYRRTVTLSGRVERPELRSAAVGIARETDGVLEVIDRIEAEGAVADGGTADDARVSVERALRANKNLAAYRLEVREENGRLVLRGHVRTGAEKDLAAALAREAARRPVENGLDVQL
jgi:osmotically-inducible protein OsmY